MIPNCGTGGSGCSSQPILSGKWVSCSIGIEPDRAHPQTGNGRIGNGSVSMRVLSKVEVWVEQKENNSQFVNC